MAENDLSARGPEDNRLVCEGSELKAAERESDTHSEEYGDEDDLGFENDDHSTDCDFCGQRFLVFEYAEHVRKAHPGGILASLADRNISPEVDVAKAGETDTVKVDYLTAADESRQPLPLFEYGERLRTVQYDEDTASRSNGFTESATTSSVPQTTPPCQNQTFVANSISLPTEIFPFELLPLESWDLVDVRKYYRTLAEKTSKHRFTQIIDWTRLDALLSLNPSRCSVGSKRWSGYVVFEFPRSPNVVLECPVTGNATYVLKGDWKALIRHSKGFIRANHHGRYVKVVHKGDWLDRIWEAIRS